MEVKSMGSGFKILDMNLSLPHNLPKVTSSQSNRVMLWSIRNLQNNLKK